MSWLFVSGGKSIGASASAGMSPSNEYSGLISFRMDWFISLQSNGLSRVFFNTTVRKHQFFGTQLSLRSNVTTGKTVALTIWTFVGKVMSLLFKTLSWFGNPGKTQVRLHCSSAQKLPKSVKSLDPHSGPWDRTHHTSHHHLSLTQQLAHWHCCGGLCTGSLSPIYKAGTLAPLSSLRLPFLSMDRLPQTPFATIHSPHPWCLPLVALACFIVL